MFSSKKNFFYLSMILQKAEKHKMKILVSFLNLSFMRKKYAEKKV